VAYSKKTYRGRAKLLLAALAIVLGTVYSPSLYRNYLKKSEPDRENTETSGLKKAEDSFSVRTSGLCKELGGRIAEVNNT
jgi:hypothetical protein